MNPFPVDYDEERYRYEVECARMREQQSLKYLAQERKPRRNRAQRAARAIWRFWMLVRPAVVTLLVLAWFVAFIVLVLTRSPHVVGRVPWQSPLNR